MSRNFTMAIVVATCKLIKNRSRERFILYFYILLATEISPIPTSLTCGIVRPRGHFVRSSNLQDVEQLSFLLKCFRCKGMRFFKKQVDWALIGWLRQLPRCCSCSWTMINYIPSTDLSARLPPALHKKYI